MDDFAEDWNESQFWVRRVLSLSPFVCYYLHCLQYSELRMSVKHKSQLTRNIVFSRDRHHVS